MGRLLKTRGNTERLKHKGPSALVSVVKRKGQLLHFSSSSSSLSIVIINLEGRHGKIIENQGKHRETSFGRETQGPLVSVVKGEGNCFSCPVPPPRHHQYHSHFRHLQQYQWQRRSYVAVMANRSLDHGRLDLDAFERKSRKLDRAS